MAFRATKLFKETCDFSVGIHSICVKAKNASNGASQAITPAELVSVTNSIGNVFCLIAKARSKAKNKAIELFGDQELDGCIFRIAERLNIPWQKTLSPATRRNLALEIARRTGGGNYCTYDGILFDEMGTLAEGTIKLAAQVGWGRRPAQKSKI